MKALTTRNLNKVLKNNSVTKRFFIGTYPACILPSNSRKCYSFITNTHLHDEPGEHWNAWFVHDNILSFFDSFGRDPSDRSLPKFYQDIIQRFSYVSFTEYRIQDFSSVTCGYFCIHFIYVLSLKLNSKFFLDDYSDDFKDNDDIVLKIVNSL